MQEISGAVVGLRRMSRSLGVKLMVVCGLALAMTIPALFVYGLLSDRTARWRAVVSEISGHLGGPQTFLGPVLAIPYRGTEEGMYIVFPARGTATATAVVSERRRSLFVVPVYQAEVNFAASFDLSGVPAAVPAGSKLEWNLARVVVGASEARGAVADAVLTAGGRQRPLEPAELNLTVDGSHDHWLQFFGTGFGDLAKPGARFDLNARMRFTGAQRIAVLAYAKATELTMAGNWPNPSFDGGFLPTSSSLRADGFTAQWSVPFLARGVAAEGSSGQLSGLADTGLGVSFVEVADPYQSVSRALKYTVLFLGVVFLTYFGMEVVSGRRIHPAQYILVGLAQVIFYLLLLALSERMGFNLGYLVAGAATVGLLGGNARWVMASRAMGLKAAAAFAVLYGLIYGLLRLEDNALLVGAVASFVVIAAAMYLTRDLDWYRKDSPSGKTVSAE